MTVSSLCPFTLISVLMPLVLFVNSLVFSVLISMPEAEEALSRRSTKFASSSSKTTRPRTLFTVKGGVFVRGH